MLVKRKHSPGSAFLYIYMLNGKFCVFHKKKRIINLALVRLSSVLLQFLYATYIAPSASMDIGLHQRKKNMIYQKIDPAFEDLFDLAEEYILILLLEPWMKMVEADKYAYGKVIGFDDTVKNFCRQRKSQDFIYSLSPLLHLILLHLQPGRVKYYGISHSYTPFYKDARSRLSFL